MLHRTHTRALFATLGIGFLPGGPPNTQCLRST
jgi:hypothetical protein